MTYLFYQKIFNLLSNLAVIALYEYPKYYIMHIMT